MNIKQRLIDFLCWMAESHRINDISKDVMGYIVDEYLESIKDEYLKSTKSIKSI